MIMVFPTLDAVCSRWPHLLVGSVVVDVQIIATGTAAETTADITEALSFIVDDLEAVELSVSREVQKLVVMSSSPASRRWLARGRFAQQLRKNTENLGGRFAVAHRRARKLRSVRKAGVAIENTACIANSGVKALATYGGSVVGFSDSAIDRLRRSMHAALVVRAGPRSKNADLALRSLYQVLRRTLP